MTSRFRWLVCLATLWAGIHSPFAIVFAKPLELCSSRVAFAENISIANGDVRRRPPEPAFLIFAGSSRPAIARRIALGFFRNGSRGYRAPL